MLKIVPPIDLELNDILKSTLDINPDAINALEMINDGDKKRAGRSNSLINASSILDYLMKKVKPDNLKLDANKINSKLFNYKTKLTKDSKNFIDDLAKILQEEDNYIK